MGYGGTDVVEHEARIGPFSDTRPAGNQKPGEHVRDAEDRREVNRISEMSDDVAERRLSQQSDHSTTDVRDDDCNRRDPVDDFHCSTCGKIAFPSVRLGGRRRTEITATTAKKTGDAISLAGSPCRANDAAAPVNSKNTPAYAHSFRRGMRGASNTTPPKTFQMPRIVSRYAG